MLALLVGAALLAASAHADTIRIPEARSLAEPTPGGAVCVNAKPCNVSALVPSIPLTFSRLAFQDGGETFGADLSLGVAATLMFARGTYHVDTGAEAAQTHTVESAVPYLLIGAGFQGGWVETPTGQAEPTTSASLFVGTRFVALTGGYDFSTRAPYVGLALVVTGTSLAPGSALVMRTWR